MTAIAALPLPGESLLARLRGPECYRDAFRAVVPGAVPLERYLAAFYASAAFVPERLVLAAIGRGAKAGDVAALAEGRTTRFAAWTVEAREEREILLRDFQDRTCSWLMVEPLGSEAAGQTEDLAMGGETALWFGSGVRAARSPVVRALVPVHRWYSRRLLSGAVRGLG